MRVTENRILQVATRGLSTARSSFSKASEELSSGVRVNRPSDDVSAWADGMRANARRMLNGSRSNAVSRAAERTTEVDTRVRRMSELMAEAQELTVQMANGVFDAESRALGATEMRALRNQMLSELNAEDAHGEYLFAGSLSDVAPFDATGTYVGDSVVRDVDIGGEVLSGTSLSGDQFALDDGTPIVDLLETLAVALENDDQATLAGSLDDIREGVSTVAFLATEVGLQMNALDSSVGAMKDFEIHLDSVIGQQLGTDPLEAAMALTQSQGAIEGSRAVIEQIVSVLRAN